MSAFVVASLFATVYTVVADPICSDERVIIADFADVDMFQKGLSNIQAKIDRSGDLEFNVYQRAEFPRPWNGRPIPMVQLVPRKSSGLVFHLDDFDPEPDGFAYTSLEFYAIAPRERAKIYVKLLQDSDGSRPESPVTWEFEAPDNKMHPVRIWLKGKLTKATKSIFFTDFSNLGQSYYIGKLVIYRNCTILVSDIAKTLSTKGKSSLVSSSGRSTTLFWLLPVIFGVLVLIALGGKTVVSRRSKIRALRREMNDALEKDDDLRLNPWAHQTANGNTDGYSSQHFETASA